MREHANCMNVKAGVHVRQIVQLENRATEFFVSTTRLMCSYDSNDVDDDDIDMNVAIIHFNGERS